MSYAFRSVGTAAHGTGALSPGAPAGVSVGDLLLLSLVCRDNGQTLSAPNPPTGWTLVSPATPVSWDYLFARIADGTADDTPTGLDYSATPHSEAQLAAFSGGGFPLVSIVTNSVSQYLPSTQTAILYSAGLTISPANCLVIAVGTKNKTATSDGTTINNLSGFTKIASYDSTNNGTDISQWWGYQIQTTPTNIAASQTQTLTGTTETLNYPSLLVALQSQAAMPAASTTYGYTGQAVTFTVNTAARYLLAAAANYSYSLAHASSEVELTANTTAYSYTGSAAAFPTYAFGFTAVGGTYAYTGKAVTFTLVLAPNPLTAASGTYAYTGQDAQLNASPLPYFVLADPGTFSLTGFGAELTFFNPGTFPNVVGLPYSMAQESLEASGAVNPAALGYFGTWPITILWTSSAVAGVLMQPGIVIAQDPLPFSVIVENAPVILTVTESPVSIATPPSQAKFPL